MVIYQFTTFRAKNVKNSLHRISLSRAKHGLGKSESIIKSINKTKYNLQKNLFRLIIIKFLHINILTM